MHRFPASFGPALFGRLTPISAAALLALAAPFAANAQFAYTPPPLQDTSSSPYYLTASQSFSHDSNVFRDPNGAQKSSDTISTTGLRLGIDQPISRQRINADFLVRYNKYQDNSQLDNTGYGLNLRGQFETAGRISGDVRYSRSETLSQYEDDRTNGRFTGRNMQTADDFGLRVQYGLRSLWVLEGQATYRNQAYSAQQYAFQEQNESALGVTLRYRPSDLLSLGLGVRGTRGELPNYQPAGGAPRGDDYDRTDIDLTSTWRVSGLTTVNGRISATNSDHKVAQENDFNGITGDIGVEYRPSGRLELNANLSRETSDTSTQFTTTLPSGGGGSSSTRLQNTRLINAFRLSADYELTGKIALNSVLRYTQRNLGEVVLVDINTGLPTGTGGGRDKTYGLAFGATYAINRAWSASCSIGRDRRTTDVNSQVTYPYGVTTGSCSAQLTLR